MTEEEVAQPTTAAEESSSQPIQPIQQQNEPQVTEEELQQDNIELSIITQEEMQQTQYDKFKKLIESVKQKYHEIETLE
jgi:hypothetical protein